MLELLAVARCGSAAKRRVGLDFERHPRRFGRRWETDAAVVLSFPERLSQSALRLPPLFAGRRTCIGHRRNFDAERRLLLLWGELEDEYPAPGCRCLERLDERTPLAASLDRKIRRLLADVGTCFWWEHPFPNL